MASASLIREVGSGSRAMPLDGTTPAEVAAFAGSDLHDAFSAGPGMPAVGPTDEPMRLDAAELDALYLWFDLGWRVLDAATSDTTVPGDRSTVQLWPERFDVGTALDRGSGAGVNAGREVADARGLPYDAHGASV